MLTIYQGHALDRLRELPDRSAHLILTSPPFFGLRDYGAEPVVWGDDATCEHTWGATLRHPLANGIAGPNGRKKNLEASRQRSKTAGAYCATCGAWRGHLGNEPTADLYVAHLVMIFAEARRVLHNDGNLLLNLGDSYASDGGKRTYGSSDGITRRGPGIEDRPKGIGDKQLLGIPWLVALALQADGWILRNDIPWIKANGMPESVKDRHGRAHEYWFHLAKGPRSYWDRFAVMVPFSDAREGRDGSRQASERNRGGRSDGYTKPNGIDPSANGGRNGRTCDMYAESLDRLIAQERAYLAHLEQIQRDGGLLVDRDGDPLALFAAVANYEDAHFATFPPDLIDPLIRAASRAGDQVLDPFFGAGTVGLVCKRLRRDCVGIEIKSEYIAMAERRINEEADPVEIEIPIRGRVLVPGGKRRHANLPADQLLLFGE